MTQRREPRTKPRATCTPLVKTPCVLLEEAQARGLAVKGRAMSTKPRPGSVPGRGP